jgi:hypothetical protein
LEFDGPDITKRWTPTPADQMLVMAKRAFTRELNAAVVRSRFAIDTLHQVSLTL